MAGLLRPRYLLLALHAQYRSMDYAPANTNAVKRHVGRSGIHFARSAQATGICRPPSGTKVAIAGVVCGDGGEGDGIDVDGGLRSQRAVILATKG